MPSGADGDLCRQELTALREERAELQWRLSAAERERTGLELRLACGSATERARRAQRDAAHQQVSRVSSHQVSLTHPSDTALQVSLLYHLSFFQELSVSMVKAEMFIE